MRRMTFTDAADSALAQRMAEDESVVVFGEDVPAIRRNLLVRFGANRVMRAPISESAFLGAAVTAAMAGLRPVVEIMLVDFMGVAFDAVLNHAAKNGFFSGGKWTPQLVIRTSCGGGYGDGGQHEQCLWGLLAHIPGLTVLVPSTPADAGGLMYAALQHPGPVVYMEHKLLARNWLDFLGYGGRKTVAFDVPAEGAAGEVPDAWIPLPIGRAAYRRRGSDLTIASLGVGAHQALEAADRLAAEGIDAEVIDLRSAAPLDRETVCESAAKTGRLLAVDEDYMGFGLSGELAAAVMEAGVAARYARVCTEQTIPYAHAAELSALPSVGRIVEASRSLAGR